MLEFQICSKLFSLLVFLPAADGMCWYPHHEANEVVSFSNQAFMNNTFPENTIASFYCENSTFENSFKFATCGLNQTWTFLDSSSDVNCSLAPSNRCQRTSKIGISPSLRSIIIEKTCFSLHYGLYDTSFENFEDECDIGTFRTGASDDESAGLSQGEIRKMCKKFLVENESQEVARKILIAEQPKKSDTAWWRKARSWLAKKLFDSESGTNPPMCYYLECPVNKRHSSVDVEVCDAEKNFWICKHNISSCGIPSQPLHSTKYYTGTYVGANATYQCEEGYVSDTSLKRTCLKSGFWSDQPPICQPVDCGKPVVYENVTYELVTKQQTTYRSWLKHSCIYPHQSINGSEYRMCLANGSWEGQSPICRESPSQLSENGVSTSDFLENLSGLNPGEADLLKLNIGIIAGVTLLLIALMWLVFGVLLWRDKRKRKNERKVLS